MRDSPRQLDAGWPAAPSCRTLASKDEQKRRAAYFQTPLAARVLQRHYRDAAMSGETSSFSCEYDGLLDVSQAECTDAVLFVVQMSRVCE